MKERPSKWRTVSSLKRAYNFRSEILGIAVVDEKLIVCTKDGTYWKNKNSKRFRKLVV